MKNLYAILLIFYFLFASGLFVEAAPAKMQHEVVMSDIFISPESLSCKQDFFVLVDVSNKGDFVEEVSVELVNQPLHIDVFSASLRLEPGARQQIILPAHVLKEPQGSFVFEARLSTDQGIKQLFQTFMFRGCPVVRSLLTSQEPSSSSLPQIQQHFPEERSVDGIVLVTGGLLFFLVMTALAALARLF